MSPPDFGDILTAAVHGGYVARLTDETYTVTSPIVVPVTSTIQGALGIDGRGATLVSQVTDGSPLIRFVVGPGVDFRYLTLSNFSILGNGGEGDGIEIVADGNDRWAYNWTISDVTVEGVGGYGLDVQGSAFEGLIVDSWMNDNALGGASFAHSPGGGVASALRWFGGGAEDNGGAGIILGDGTRDLGVDGASFANNDGPGISALWGITAVTDSSFVDNQGAGVQFQNYGNFNDNTFSTSGSQTVGIDGYLAGTATLTGNDSLYTGAGPDPTTLADLQGHGGLFLTDNSGQVVNGPHLVPNAMDGDMANVSVGTQGVALPPLAAVTAATTAARASSTGSGALESALRAAMAGGSVAHLTDAIYTVTTPIVINVTSSTQGPVGIDLGGAKILSQITNGLPVIEIIVGPGVDMGSLTLSNFSIFGNGREGDGIKIVADGPDRSAHDWTISNVNVEHVGGIGLDVLGNAAQGTVFNSWMHGNDQGGARFANSAGGGVASALEWVGGGVRKNGVAGLILDNGTRDMTVTGAYFVENDGPGIYATSGITSVRVSGFENNLGAGAIVQNSASFANDTFATYGRQTTGIGGHLVGGQVVLTGVGNEYYGAGSDPTMLANLQGRGSLAIASSGNVVAGPDVAVTGVLSRAIESDGATSLIQSAGGYFLEPIDEPPGPRLKYSGAPVTVGQFGLWAPIGAEQIGNGYQVAWKRTDSDQYTVWNTDIDGNYLSNAFATASGSSSLLQSFESAFQQDLNGSGAITPMTTIEAFGSTRLVEVTGNYFLYPVDGSVGPPLSFGGAPVAAGQFGAAMPIGAEQTAGGYTIAWRVSADQYSVWSTDSSGNYLSSSPAAMPGASAALQSLEPGFHQDLNGDGTIGPVTTTIEAFGSTRLVEIAGNFFLHPVDGPSGPLLKYFGAPATADLLSPWQPIAAEQTAGGYQVAWKNADQYTVWNTDSSGNFLSNPLGNRSGASLALQSFEPGFHQDLNGDGTIGPATTTIEAFGSTRLAQVADNYFLYPVDGSVGPPLSFGGAPVAAGQFGAAMPIGAEQTAGGYAIAWRVSADQYSVWSTDSSGNYLSSSPAAMPGASAALQSLEPGFHQDLNSDGTIGAPGAAGGNNFVDMVDLIGIHFARDFEYL